MNSLYDTAEPKFRTALRENNLEKFKQLEFEYSHILKSSFYDLMFQHSCASGYLDIAKWLLEIKPNIDIFYNNNELFYDSCDHLEVLKWLYQINPNIDISYNNNHILYNALEFSELDIVKWIFTIKPINDISYDLIFISCNNSDLDMVQFLLECKPTIDISYNNEECFRTACINGNLELVTFLLEFKPTIDITANDDEAFKYVCNNGSLEFDRLNDDISLNEYQANLIGLSILIEIAELLVSIKPNKYSIHTTILNHNIAYTINNITYTTNNISNTMLQQNTIIFTTDIIYISEIDVCSICKEHDNDIQTNCKHNFCTSCICSWLIINNTCPFCRQSIDCLNKIKLTENN